MLVSIVTADALALKHQTISIHNTNPTPAINGNIYWAPKWPNIHFEEKWRSHSWVNAESKWEFFTQENVFENVFGKWRPFLRRQCVNEQTISLQVATKQFTWFDEMSSVNPLDAFFIGYINTYRQPSTISHTLAGNKTVDHSDVVGASPVGAAPTTSSFSIKHLVSMDWAETTARRDENQLRFEIWCVLY